ncbi:hypothetical protein C0Q70_11956 [Pomacea canaliculata]|uniref:Uncharacterized protein n=1 Tax=Pomacea canaliculata TaxID=400727 RepID=A0A2T7P7G2_POMCA|nr:hypothetical protein C0Q70_11956 [Pomacea canaliculata]
MPTGFTSKSHVGAFSIMAAPSPQVHSTDATYDEFARSTPVPTPTHMIDRDPPYRCPVCTPANVHPTSYVGRVRPASLAISPSDMGVGRRAAGGRVGRSSGGAPTEVRGGQGVWAPGKGANYSRGLDYYYVDKKEERLQEAKMNTFWLRTLCAQPVSEILTKYSRLLNVKSFPNRRRSELRQTKVTWSQTNTTPGERSLMQAWTRNVSRRVVPRVTVKDIPGCTSEQKVLPFRRNPTQEILNLVFSEQSDSLGVWTDDHVVNDHHQKVYPFNDTAALAQRSGHSQGKKASSIFMNRQIKKTPEIPPPQPVSASDYFQTILPDPIILKAAQQQRLALNTTRVPSDDYSPAIATSSPDSLADTQPAVSHGTVLPAIRQERS